MLILKNCIGSIQLIETLQRKNKLLRQNGRIRTTNLSGGAVNHEIIIHLLKELSDFNTGMKISAE